MPITVTPAGTITFVKTPLENDYKNTFTFSSLANQNSYFTGLSNSIVAGTDYTYMKKDGKIRVARPIEDIINYNYCFYNNAGFTQKRYYCFVTRMEYINENCTDVYIETDVFQTWYFEINWNPCYVEREHVNNDAIGLHTYPENLETGEYVNNSTKTLFGVGPCHAVVCTSEDPFNKAGSYPFQVINDVPSGLHYFLCGGWETGDTNFIGWLTNWAATKSDLSLIQAIYMVPDSMTDYANISTNQSAEKHWSWALPGNMPKAAYYKLSTRIEGAFDLGTTHIAKPYTSINGYVPHNNKLFCWPYNFLMVDNGGGHAYEYRYENFSTTTCDFYTIGAITPGCSIKTIPKDYEGIQVNHANALIAMKLPIGSWQGDVYTNWLTQNSVNLGTSVAGDMASIAIGGAMIAGGLTIGGTGNLVSGVTGISNTLGTIYQHSRIPNQVFGDTNSGDVTFADGAASFTAYQRTIKAEYARVIDSYFDMFGYKVNTVKVPNITGRSQWNFIKTIDCNVEGDIPQEDLNTIRKSCNTGITFFPQSTILSKKLT